MPPFKILPPESENFATPGLRQTILVPQTANLIAPAIEGRREAIKISFLQLNRPDQLWLSGLARLNTVFTGNFPHFADFH
jgi:hypothetical protein